LTYYMEYTI